MSQVSIKKNFLYNASFQILLMIVPLITAPYVSRVLGPGNIGIQSYTDSIVSYFVLFATCGLNMYGQREIAYHNSSVAEKSRIFWEVVINKFVLTVFAIICYLEFVSQTTEYRLVFMWQMITLISCIFDISWYYQGIQDFKSIVKRNVVVKLIGVACIFSFIHTSDDLLLYIIILTGTTLFGNLILWLYIPHMLVRVPFKLLHPFRDKRIKLELFAPFIAIQIYTVLDKTMIGLITNDVAQNGYYEQSQKIVRMALGVITSLGTVLIPNIAEKFARHDYAGIRETAMKSFHFIILCACPMTCGLIAIAPVFVPWFFGPGYDEVIILLQIFSFLCIIIALSNIAGAGILTPINRQNYGTLATVAGAVTNFALNIFLIQIYAAKGAAIASVIAESVVTILHIYFVRKYVHIKSIITWLEKYFPAAIFMGALVYFLGSALQILNVPGPFITIIQVFLGALIYAIIIGKVFNEVDMIKRMIKR